MGKKNSPSRVFVTLWTEKDRSLKKFFLIFLQAHKLCVCLFQLSLFKALMSNPSVRESKLTLPLKQASMRLFWAGVLTAFKDAGGYEIYQPKFYWVFSGSQVIFLPKLASLLQGEWLNGGDALLLRNSSVSQTKHMQKDTGALRREEHRGLTVGIPVDCSVF